MAEEKASFALRVFQPLSGTQIEGVASMVGLVLSVLLPFPGFAFSPPRVAGSCPQGCIVPLLSSPLSNPSSHHGVASWHRLHIEVFSRLAEPFPSITSLPRIGQAK